MNLKNKYLLFYSKPLSKFPSLPQPPTSETAKKTKWSFDESVESLAPLSNLPPVGKNSHKDYTGMKHFLFFNGY